MSLESSADQGRGRDAKTPEEIPLRGWRDILIRVKRSVARDRLSIISAGVAFYLFLAIFPAIGALMSFYGLLFDPEEVGDQIAKFGSLLPRDAVNILVDQLRDIAGAPPTTLGFAALGSLLLALWSATQGMKTLMAALNVAYNENERRSFIRVNGVAMTLTLGLIIGASIAIAVIVALPVAAAYFGTWMASIVMLLSWPVLAVISILALNVIYRFGPSRRPARWRWVSWGAVIAMLLWLLGSVLFSFYAVHFGNYNKTYGSVGAVAILLMWLFISAYIVLIGAEINREMERQTVKDTTVGAPKPLGSRDAYAADTVGPTP